MDKVREDLHYLLGQLEECILNQQNQTALLVLEEIEERNHPRLPKISTYLPDLTGSISRYPQYQTDRLAFFPQGEKPSPVKVELINAESHTRERLRR